MWWIGTGEVLESGEVDRKVWKMMVIRSLWVASHGDCSPDSYYTEKLNRGSCKQRGEIFPGSNLLGNLQREHNKRHWSRL